jgi:UDP-2-acetamido-3-amino-2,3-dideoxy-glucuronate N-acetyltransferase
MTTAIETGKKSFFQHPHALVDSEHIGDRTRVWAFAHVMAGAQVGSDCNVGEHAYIEGGARLGNNVTVKNGVSIWSGITVEDNVFLGPHCVLTNDPNPRAYIKKSSDAMVETLIRANATIGANATIVCGVTIGHYAFIGAGTVVIRSVPDFALVVGNPARQIGWMCVCANKLPLPVVPASGASCRCTHCGRSFSATLQVVDQKRQVEVKEG